MHKSLKKKEVLIPLSIIVIILLIIFGAKILLFINFLVGNDIVIKLEADKEILSLKHNEKENINNFYKIFNIAPISIIKQILTSNN